MNDKNRKVLYLLDKETINLGRTEKTQWLGLRVMNGEGVTRKTRVSLMRFGCRFLWRHLWADKESVSI